MRRVVASPRPLRIPEADVVDKLMSAGVIAIAAGGGGVPVAEAADGTLYGVDAVVDKDLSSALLARSVEADTLAILMETDAVYSDWGTPAQRELKRTTPDELEALARGRPVPGRKHGTQGRSGDLVRAPLRRPGRDMQRGVAARGSRRPARERSIVPDGTR